LLEVNQTNTFDLAFSIPGGFIFVSVHTSLGNGGNEILITNKALELVNRINLDGDNDFKIHDAKISNGKLYIGGSHIVTSNQINPPKNSIRVFDYSGQPLSEITLPTDIESFDLFENGDILYTSRFSRVGEIFKVSQTGEILERLEFPELAGTRKKTLVATNGDIYFSVANDNSYGEGTPGVYRLKVNTEELTSLAIERFYNIKQIENKVFAVGLNILSFDLNGNQINTSGNLTDKAYNSRFDQPFTNIAPFRDGYVVSGFRMELFYIDSNLKTIWGYQTKSTVFDIGNDFYSHGLLTDGNNILLSGDLFSNVSSAKDGIITIIKYEY
jgi:hypothetical protein